MATRYAKAQIYPTRPVHIIVGFSAGGPTDILARLMGQYETEKWSKVIQEAGIKAE